MQECFKCGIYGSKIKLYDAIFEKGIVQVCEECAMKERIPVIKKPSTFQLKESEKEPVKFKDRVRKFEQSKTSENALLRKQNTTLRDLVDKNFELKVNKEIKKPRDDLAENFNWIILRARRAKKLTQTQFAKAIAESEAAIRLAERGILPDDDYKLINKIETFLGIRLLKGEFAEKFKNRAMKLDVQTLKTLTIEDLREMRKKRKERDEGEPEFNKGNLPKEAKALYNKDRELTEEEVDDILMGRK